MYYEAIDENNKVITSGWQAEIHELEQKILDHLAENQMMTAYIVRSKRLDDDDREKIASYTLSIDYDSLYLERSKL